MKFIKYLLLWISGNLSIPFWMVGHVHLTMNVYDDIYEILASFGMNIIVAIGFWISWIDYKKEIKSEQFTLFKKRLRLKENDERERSIKRNSQERKTSIR